MTTPNDGGPAFPIVETFGPSGSSGRIENGYGGVRSVGGMSLRDYFAAHASEEDILEFIPQTYGECKDFQQLNGFWPSRQWARYAHADKMLKAMGMKVRGAK